MGKVRETVNARVVAGGFIIEKIFKWKGQRRQGGGERKRQGVSYLGVGIEPDITREAPKVAGV